MLSRAFRTQYCAGIVVHRVGSNMGPAALRQISQLSAANKTTLAGTSLTVTVNGTSVKSLMVYTRGDRSRRASVRGGGGVPEKSVTNEAASGFRLPGKYWDGHCRIRSGSKG